ncbi:hypothetical protein QTP70_011702 [Hemibagrus guttatus]|uniref:Uncharacterized protein n=1 Tax=Hemibagrus guttatus TaxID=175788 RepID=A0AAE0VBL9_9TELE|nr:hypothetical protein QTP70_011702 [Hemibagrus guttatus]
MYVFGLGEETGVPGGNARGTGRTCKLHTHTHTAEAGIKPPTLEWQLKDCHTRDLSSRPDPDNTMERQDRRAHGFGVAGRRPLCRSLRRCFESAHLLRFVAELSRFLSDVLDNLPALAEASPLQSGPDVPDPDDVPDLADELEPDALNLAGRPSPSPPPSSPSSTSSFSPFSPSCSYSPTSPTAHLADISAEE